MRRTQRLPARLIRWTSLCVCFALVFASQTLITQSSNGKGTVFDQQVPQDINRQPANGRGKARGRNQRRRKRERRLRDFQPPTKYVSGDMGQRERRCTSNRRYAHDVSRLSHVME